MLSTSPIEHLRGDCCSGKPTQIPSVHAVGKQTRVPTPLPCPLKLRAQWQITLRSNFSHTVHGGNQRRFSASGTGLLRAFGAVALQHLDQRLVQHLRRAVARRATRCHSSPRNRKSRTPHRYTDCDDSRPLNCRSGGRHVLQLGMSHRHPRRQF